MGQHDIANKSFPKWLLWVGIGVVILCLIGSALAVALGGGIFFFLQREKEQSSLISSEREDRQRVRDEDREETEEPVEEVEAPVVEEPAVEELATEEPVVEETEEMAVEETEWVDNTLGTEENPLIWAIVPSGQIEDILEGFYAITDIIYQETGLVIEAFVATEYAGVIEALSTDPPKAHIASLATFAYLVAAERGVAEAELVSVRFGSPSYQGEILARADSGIDSIDDLKGTTFCRPDPYSTSGWIIPSITMVAAGIDPERDLEILDAGGHDGVVAAIYNGDCDAGSAFVDARVILEEDYPDVMERVIVISETVDIPNDGVQYHPSVPRQVRDQINAVLLNCSYIDGCVDALDLGFWWTELGLYGDDFYDPFRNVLSAAGVDIADFIGE